MTSADGLTREVVERPRKVIVASSMPISSAIAVLDKSGLGVLLVCEDERKLVGVITDGDIRRALLRGVSLHEPCDAIANRNPVVARHPVGRQETLDLLDHSKTFLIAHLPILDADGRVVGLILRSDLMQPEALNLSALVMAGGFGRRLSPLTDTTPKTMLPIGNRPLLERVIDQLRDVGIRRVAVSTHYRSQQIVSHFADGGRFGVDITYLNEEQPLGTAGALRLMDAPADPILVINGDVLTKLDFRSMFDFHKEHKADMTVAVRRHLFDVPYGVVKCEGVVVTALDEKPQVALLVNAGIYLLEPDLLKYIPPGATFHMTELIETLLRTDRRIVGFLVHEYWLDIGQHEDYARANREWADS